MINLTKDFQKILFEENVCNHLYIKYESSYFQMNTSKCYTKSVRSCGRMY